MCSTIPGRRRSWQWSSVRGGEVADGLEMLAHQADMQLRSMLGIPAAPVAEMLAAARTELARRHRSTGM